jgi:filamentous hemagglutinin family protein
MLVSFLPTAALALPTLPQVASGTANITTSGNNMTVTNSTNAIINWQSFSIGQNESTRFIQPSAASAVLNRITGGDPSKILGVLQSNGKVLLINPNGILFGQNARVDVNGLIASTLNITNQDFLAGKMNFSAGPLAGKIDNQGTITTPGGGQVYLIAPDVTNSGVITAPNGDILLAAGKEVLLVDKNNPEIAMVVSAPEHQAINLGTLVADAGRVGVYGGIVRQKGRISADSAVMEGGKIFLRATKSIDLADTSVISADGSNGGQIIAMTAEDGKISGTLTARGTISAQGDGTTGSGGFIETSAAKVDLNGIDVRTNGGNWLIDPNFDFTIGSGKGGTVIPSSILLSPG